MEPGIVFGWERLPEYIAAQQYGRCLGRIFGSLPRRVRRRVMQPMTGAALMIAEGIAGFNAELPPETLSDRERELFRSRALEGVRLSREALEVVRRVRRASRPDLLVAAELLDRIEGSVRVADAPPSWL